MITNKYYKEIIIATEEIFLYLDLTVKIVDPFLRIFLILWYLERGCKQFTAVPLNLYRFKNVEDIRVLLDLKVFKKQIKNIFLIFNLLNWTCIDKEHFQTVES